MYLNLEYGLLIRGSGIYFALNPEDLELKATCKMRHYRDTTYYKLISVIILDKRKVYKMRRAKSTGLHIEQPPAVVVDVGTDLS